MANESESVVRRETYRHLRLMLITLPVLLLVATLIAHFSFVPLRGSISAYYHAAPVRDIFVGTMVGTAVCLVVYRGASRLEDYCLNLGGFFAMFVAFVPTRWTQYVPADQRDSVLSALRLATIAIVVVTAAFVWAEWKSGHWTLPELLKGKWTKRFYLLSTVAAGGFAVLLARGWIVGDFLHVHNAAAILLIVSLAFAVFCHGWPDGEDMPRPAFRKTYQTIFFAMLAGPFLAIPLAVAEWMYTVITLEWYEIGLFAWFWIMETLRLQRAERGGVTEPARTPTEHEAAQN